MLASPKSQSAFDHFEDFCRRVAFERFDTFDENRQKFAVRVPRAREHHYANFPLDFMHILDSPWPQRHLLK